MTTPTVTETPITHGRWRPQLVGIFYYAVREGSDTSRRTFMLREDCARHCATLNR